MLKLEKVAITGGLSCGKSSVCRYFKELGAYVISADEIVHQLLIPTNELGQEVIALLGKDIAVNGTIDRSMIAKKVFENKTLLLSLEKLIHIDLYLVDFFLEKLHARNHKWPNQHS